MADNTGATAEQICPHCGLNSDTTVEYSEDGTLVEVNYYHLDDGMKTGVIVRIANGRRFTNISEEDFQFKTATQNEGLWFPLSLERAIRVYAENGDYRELKK